MAPEPEPAIIQLHGSRLSDVARQTGFEALHGSEQDQYLAAMARFLPFGTVDQGIAQMGELAEAMKGHITGANLIVEAGNGHRYEVTGIRWEPTVEHPEGRLILVTSECVHWSEDCDKSVLAANETKEHA